MPDDSISSLREAVKLSPDNLPLRLTFVDALLGANRADEAETECRGAISKFPDDLKLKSRLAEAFFRQGKTSQAMVVVEDLARKPDAPARALVLFARLLAGAGDVERAVRQYKKAMESDPSTADSELADRLGIRPERDAKSPFDHDDDDGDEVVDGKVRASFERGAGDGAEVEVERPKVNFADVGGMESLKEEIQMKIIHPLAHADLYKAYGKPIGGGILMYGPPGCGKTHLARATAGEIRAASCPSASTTCWTCGSAIRERNLHELFEQARRAKPCVLFFDEVDALAASRADMRTSAGRHLINQFLAEMDGVKSSNDGVLILAATNAPWHVDPRFAGPGGSTASCSSRPPTRRHGRACCGSCSRASRPNRSTSTPSRRRPTASAGPTSRPSSTSRSRRSSRKR
jgi:hypothetical protein